MAATVNQTSQILRPAKPGILSGLLSKAGAIANGIAGFFATFGNAVQVTRELERLAQRSDNELAAEGLTRSQAQERLIERHFG